VSQILKWERDGLLTPIAMPGIRVVVYEAEQVRDLARQIIETGRRRTTGAATVGAVAS